MLAAAGVYVFDIDVPAGATGEMASRFRFTATAGEGGASATGAATSGEVEDYLLASIGDFVFNDNNLDGTQDGGDTPQAGVVVNLLEADGTTPVLDGDGNPVTTVTDASGNYIFSGVPTEDAAGNPIDYTVEFENPAGTLFTSQIGAVTDPTNSDANTTTGVTGTISVNPGDQITYVDAGLINLDYGDLPDPLYGGVNDASHAITTELQIGSVTDAEIAAQPNGTATGDDTTGSPDDEDGFTAPAAIIAGQTVGFDVVVSNDTGSDATLYGFVDWNADGDFDDAGETVTASVADGVTNATETLTFTVPLGAVTGADLGTRFRLSTDTGLAAGGTASNGEVEDYLIQVNDALLDYGDLPDGPYPTLSGNSGPSHVIDGVTFLGATVDAENNGQPNASATGDDTTGAPDDEDGVVFLTPFVPGGTAQIQITTSSPGALSSFIDFDGDGTLDAVTFSAVTGPGALPAPGLLSDALLSAAGVYVFDIDVPLTATGEMASRFRFTATAGEGGANATGAATSGEVEDYLLASIGDFVFNDNNLDGTQDGGDTPQAGVPSTCWKPTAPLRCSMATAIPSPPSPTPAAITSSPGFPQKMPPATRLTTPSSLKIPPVPSSPARSDLSPIPPTVMPTPPPVSPAPSRQPR